MATSEWSLPLGNWLGSRWRISWVLLTVCLIILTISFWRPPTPADSDLSVLGPIVVLVFAASLIIREIIDWLLSRSAGVAKGDVCIGPLGNMVPRRPTAAPRRDLFLAASGPITHLLLGLIGLSICLAYQLKPQMSWLNPVTPPPLQGRWEWPQIGVAMWIINWSLALLRLLPTQPLDGHMILLSTIRMTRSNLPNIWAGLIVRHIGLLIGALALGFSLGAFLWGTNPGLIPDWIIPASIAVFLVWGAVSRLSTYEYSEETSDEPVYRTPVGGFPPASATPLRRNADIRNETGYDPGFSPQSDDYFYDEDDNNSEWDDDSWDEKVDGPKEPSNPDLQKMDAILAKIHDLGPDSLSPEERDLLAKASEFLRHKRGEEDKT
jgi:Zn-dependent protease